MISASLKSFTFKGLCFKFAIAVNRVRWHWFDGMEVGSDKEELGANR